MKWHDYEQQYPSADKDRPWWIGEVHAFVRTDGAKVSRYAPGWDDLLKGSSKSPRHREAMKAALAAFDAEHPLPVPPPRCGQIWVYVQEPDGWQDQVTYVSRPVEDPRGRRVVFGSGKAVWTGYGDWPPSGCVLVQGEGAPWAPMGGDDVD